MRMFITAPHGVGSRLDSKSTKPSQLLSAPVTLSTDAFQEPPMAAASLSASPSWNSAILLLIMLWRTSAGGFWNLAGRSWSTNMMRPGTILSTTLRSSSRWSRLKTVTRAQTCKETLTNAFPISTPPKNSQKGSMKCPQQIPQRSNMALGHELRRSTAQNPYPLMSLNIQAWQKWMTRDTIPEWFLGPPCGPPTASMSALCLPAFDA
mmetsp:Transcript_16137/g.38278  ORF Transcript_16137/g.38278 Transcript_16137/m.38278 type:complete len:207 (-) Transcript_16137:1264-1884(-)